MVKRYFIATWVFLFAAFSCPAQISSSNAEAARRGEGGKETSDKSQKDSAVVFQKRGLLPFKKSISREQKKTLAPDASDLKNYELFLSQPKTGLIKLLPDLGCEENSAIVRVDEICLKAIPMSGAFSFRENEYTNDFLSDIRLKNGILITDGVLIQGVLVALGDVALETVTAGSDGMKFINEFVPETQSAEALKQTTQLVKGVKSGEFLYRKALPAAENTTYALRLVAYRGRLWQSVHGKPFDMLAGDKRFDLTLTFRVLKKDEAGSLTLLWKELARKDAPKIIFSKNSKKPF